MPLKGESAPKAIDLRPEAIAAFPVGVKLASEAIESEPVPDTNPAELPPKLPGSIRTLSVPLYPTTNCTFAGSVCS